jgi:hypothetical protein
MTEQLGRPTKMKYLLHGFASTFDITGRNFVRQDESEASGFEKDYLALCKDWVNVGNDCRKAIDKVIYGK